MERLPPAVLAQVLELLTARDVARLTRSCAALAPSSPALRDALGLVIMRRFGDVAGFLRFGDVAGFLRADDPSWPRSALTLRCVEVLRVKELLVRARVSPFEDAASCRGTSVVVSKAWFVAWKRSSQVFEQLALQLRPSKKKAQQQRARKKHVEAQPAGLDPESHGEALHAASNMIVCAHNRLLPLAQCVGRSRRVILTRATFRKLAVYAPELRAFPLESCVDCNECIKEQETRELEAEEKKRSRFETEIKGSAPLVDLLLRKSGYPNNLFAPGEPSTTSSSSPRPLSLVQRGPRGNGSSYFLVPKKWLIKWRKFVRSQGDEAPGPILNSELVCLAHRRSVVPPYISMFLSGYSLEQSLRATQGLAAYPARQYEIVTFHEWEALYDRYCAEFAVGFDVRNGAYQWKTQECQICYYGMAGSGVGKRISNRF